MSNDERKKLIKFCVEARTEIEGLPEGIVDESEFAAMNDEELTREADWLDDLLGK